MDPIDAMTNQLTTTTTEPPKMSDAKVQSIAEKALRDILAQADGMLRVTRNALDVCRKIGDAASKAKNALGHGKFTPWVEKNFGPDTGAPFTPQWIRMCMRVHEVFVRLEGHKDREKIIDQFGNDVKNFARLLALMEGGNNPLTFKPEKRAKAAAGGSGAGAESDNTVSAKMLQRKLDAAEKKVADLTAKLEAAQETIKLQKLEIATLKADAKDAAKASKRRVGDVTDVTPKDPKAKALKFWDAANGANEKAKAEKAKPKAPAKKAAPKAAAKPKAPAKPKAVKAKAAAPAPQPEPEEPETPDTEVPDVDMSTVDIFPTVDGAGASV